MTIHDWRIQTSKLEEDCYVGWIRTKAPHILYQPLWVWSTELNRQLFWSTEISVLNSSRFLPKSQKRSKQQKKETRQIRLMVDGLWVRIWSSNHGSAYHLSGMTQLSPSILSSKMSIIWWYCSVFLIESWAEGEECRRCYHTYSLNSRWSSAMRFGRARPHLRFMSSKLSRKQSMRSS